VATDLMQFLIEENPYGYDTNLDLNPSVETVRQELTALRPPDGLPQEEISKRLRESQHIDGPACRFTNANPAPNLASNAPHPLVPDKETVFDLATAGLFWHFKGKQVRISKAMKLTYSVGGTSYDILIGFQGAGGGM
jgi:hypothetical protein